MPALPQSPLAPVPVKPACLVWYAGDPCDQAIQQYHEAETQLQQQEWQVTLAAPLQKQIADQQNQITEQQGQIRTLQLRIQSQTEGALRSEARNDALLNGIGAGLGAGLAFLVAVVAFRRLARNATASNHEQSRAASA